MPIKTPVWQPRLFLDTIVKIFQYQVSQKDFILCNKFDSSIFKQIEANCS